ncbi:hypothetical protein GCM10023221_27760 [Luteimicrobium xylanilyticum]|uniref:DUF4192 domain-containing protein n=1 Tax=Luteimicrobium xylanilyticum TaxID=1133546 RepID=A0A5P9QAT1_9MICO|nr:DUF4192 domain-containing protein [Luteimicrobium xylanilyticum]QFU98561.1 hypothetical protein KDY119_02077 [Luteimicrobium xylanilyticum]
MDTPLLATRPADLLAYVPYRLGYRPRDSVVVLSLRPPRGAVGLVVRSDVRDLLSERGGAALARTVAAHVLRDGPREVVLVAYGDDETASQDAADVLADALAGAGPGVPVAARWHVTSTGYRSLGCADPECCPVVGHPLTDLDASHVAADLVYAGVSVAASREEAYALAPVDPARRASAIRAARRWARRREELGVRAWRRASLRAWRDVHAAVAAAEPLAQEAASCPGPAQVAAARVGRVAGALTDPIVRDAVLLTLLPTGDPGLPDRMIDAASTGVGIEALEDAVSAVTLLVDPRRGVAPDVDGARVARIAAEVVASHARGDGHAYALGLAAALAWWAGDGGLAGARADRALQVGPDHGLARLVADALDRGVGPGWAQAEHLAVR